MTSTEQTRLSELRAKTDRDLVTLLSKRLDFAVSGLLSSVDSISRPEAEEIYAEAGAVMPLIYQLPVKKRKQLEARLGQLRMLLKEGINSPGTGVYAAC